jgi:hypothetical protein
LTSLSELYREASERITRARRSIVDTTWGSDIPAHLQGPDCDDARGDYRKALEEAAARLSCHEIYTVTSAEARESLASRLRQAVGRERTFRLLRGISAEWPLLDFLVIDGEWVLLARSHAHQQGPQEAVFYVIRDRALGSLLADWFWDCWQLGWDVSLVNGELQARREDITEAVDEHWSERH